MMRLMPGRAINALVIHCAASLNGVSLARIGHPGKTAAQVIDGWHRERGFERSPKFRLHCNGHLAHIGYHYVIDVDGGRESGRDIDERGAHARGHNYDTVGICLVGTDKFTRAQWATLRQTVTELLSLYPAARVCGHRDLSPDVDGNGKVERHEWLKTCPGFEANDWWLTKGMQPLLGHIVER